MSNDTVKPSGAFGADAPLSRSYFYEDGAGAIGPVLGAKLKELIENGVVARHSRINTVGEPNWAPIASVEPFASSFPAASAATEQETQKVFANFWPRLGAYAIDQTLAIVATFIMANVVLTAASLIWGFDASRDYVLEHRYVANAIGLLTVLTFQAFFLTGRWRATPGKRLFGVYVMRADGSRLDAPIAVLRYLCFLLTAPVGFLSIFWTDERKALHDIICGTRVVYGRVEPEPKKKL